jgi:glycosyltransferase involved in cell wall biosynthesis
VTKPTILMATNLNVWSLAKGSGAPSFYKTLELYNQKGHTVYLYTTEQENPVSELQNVKFIRLPKLATWNVRRLSNAKCIFNYLLNQIIFLYVYAQNSHKTDLLYAYEIEFVPVLKLLSLLKNVPLVSRFQGTILHPLMRLKYWQLKFFPHYFSLKIRADTTIMTNDGTKGDAVLSNIRGASCDDVLFLFNGTRRDTYDLSKVSERVKSITQAKNGYDCISVSRLERWKKVDRTIDVFKRFHEELPNSRLLIVGDGSCLDELSRQVSKEGLSEVVIFLGSINQEEVDYILANSDIFLSHYELSNVGNPLWEALRRKCLVVTIDNGDTGKVIEDGVNGILSKESDYFENAQKIIVAINNGKIDALREIGHETYEKLTVSWDQRMEQEYECVAQLFPTSGRLN